LAFWASVVSAQLHRDERGEHSFQYSEMLLLLHPVWSRLITSYAEFRHAFRTTDLIPLPPPLGMHHSFLLLELDGRDLELCLERFDDSLEMMIGEREAMRDVAKRFRATGEPRQVDGQRPIEELPRVQLGPAEGLPAVRVEDLYGWIKGPLAAAWQPREADAANCQHFTGDLQSFLRCKQNDVRVHALHPRPPKVSPVP